MLTWRLLTSPDDLLIRLVFAVFNGHVAVSVFFVLSGFVLALSLHRDDRPLGRKSAAFAGRRFFRIYPALAVNLVIAAAILWLLAQAFPQSAAAPTASQLWKNLLLQEFMVNGATWTLLIELLAVPLMLVAHIAHRHFGLGGLMALLAAALAFLFAPNVVRSLVPSDTPFGFYLRSFLIDYQFMFLLGMLMAELSRRGMLDMGLLTARIGVALSLAGMLAARPTFGYASRWAILVEGLGCAVLVAILALDHRLGIKRLLECRPAQYLGRISYSFYLYHAIAISIVFALWAWLTPFGIDRLSLAGCLIAAALCVTVAVPMSRASYELVERPMMRLGRHF
jgi:peptidoglycan/LPS O-acetylase OafA/YrhL